MIRRVVDLLSLCGTQNEVFPPTDLFNEGWMLRLVLDWLHRSPSLTHPFSFHPGARWYSEARLPSRFPPTYRGDPLGESTTHADGIIGHFQISPGKRAEAALSADTSQFVVVEAKLGSPLSKGVTNAPNYGQASRTVACIAHMVQVAGLRPDSLRSLGFFVVAPQRQIDSGLFEDFVTKERIRLQVMERVAAYGGTHGAWFEESFLPTLAVIDLGLMSWEEIIGESESQDSDGSLAEFYAECLRFNPLRGNSTG